ncbi:hypothetical protein B0H19DRAFT_922437 [Mycena capillaripes]|nr:hypothetical protein B0H19DRAFT_922437 [Mycena capillaripes]
MRPGSSPTPATLSKALTDPLRPSVPPSFRLIPLYTSSLPRKTVSTLAQLRTGPSHLNVHRFKSGFTDSPACNACGAPFETRAHFLLERPVWNPSANPCIRLPSLPPIRPSPSLPPPL